MVSAEGSSSGVPVTASRPGLGYRPELDGVRAVAIALVVATHSFILAPFLKHQVTEGGFLGVDLFFVLSGFLITALLLEEHDAAGRISLGRFYGRRAVRLIPALWLLLAVSWAYDVWKDYPAAFGSPQATLSNIWHAVTYTSNTHAYRAGYTVGDLGHLWSLALEGQFYLWWAPLLILMLRVERVRRRLPWIVGALVVLVAANRLRVYVNDGWLYAYHRSDTRIDGLLVGSLAAVLRQRGLVPTRWLPRAATGALVVVAAGVAVLRGNKAPAYYGGLLAVNLAVAVIVLAALDGRWRPAAALRWRPAVTLGRVSYGVYLWHYPMFWAVERWTSSDLGPLRWLIGVVATGAAVTASWFLVERPAARWWRRFEAGRPARRARRQERARYWDTPDGVVQLDARRRFTRWTGAGALVSACVYLFVLWDGAWRPFRTAVPEGYFSHIYDLQARAMMDGHFAVPSGSLGIEGFISRGKEYTYFPPLPSIIRMPVLMHSGQWDGRLSAPSMLLAWLLTVVFGIMLMWHVRLRVRGRVPMGRAEAATWAVLVVAVFGGSTWVYLASMPWAYHEAFAWGCAGAVAALYALARVIEGPTRGRVVALGVATLAAIWSRSTTGWGVAFGILLTAAWFAFARDGRRRWWPALALAAMIPVLAGSAVTYAKFRTLWMHPLDSQVWTQQNEQRRLALAANDGRLTGLQFFPSTVEAYFSPLKIDFSRTVPFVDLPADPPPIVGRRGAYFDQTYRTASVPATMPALFLLCGVGLVALALARRRSALAGLRAPVAGALVGTAGVLCYGYISERYVQDFVPALTIGAIVGVAVVVDRLATVRRGARLAVLGAVGVLTVYGVVANTSIAWWNIRVNYGGERLVQMVRERLRIGELTGAGQVVRAGPVLPRASEPGELFVADGCRAVYLGTAETYDPWTAVEIQPLAMDVTVPRGVKVDPVRIMSFDVEQEIYLTVETTGTGWIRFGFDIPYLPTPGPWMRVTDGTVRIDVTPDTVIHHLFVDADRKLVGFIPTGNFDQQAYKHQAWVEPVVPDASSGVKVVEVPWQPSPLCAGLQRQAAPG